MMAYSVYPDFVLPRSVPAPALYPLTMSISEKLRAFYQFYEDDNLDYVVDFQSFKSDGGDFIHKELAVVPVEGDAIIDVYLFKPPFKWDKQSSKQKRENSWIERRLTGIPWSSGRFEYDSVTEILEKSLIKAKRIYVKGFEKKKWLEERLPTSAIKVIDMEVLGCPSLKHFHKIDECENHSLLSESQCAGRNVNALRFWLQTYRDIFGEDICY